MRGLVPFPEGPPEGGSNFNDLHQAASLDAVQRDAQAANGGRTGKGGHGHVEAPSGAAGDDGPFTVNDAGVWHQGVDQDGK